MAIGGGNKWFVIYSMPVHFCAILTAMKKILYMKRILNVCCWKWVFDSLKIQSIFGGFVVTSNSSISTPMQRSRICDDLTACHTALQAFATVWPFINWFHNYKTRHFFVPVRIIESVRHLDGNFGAKPKMTLFIISIDFFQCNKYRDLLN